MTQQIPATLEDYYAALAAYYAALDALEALAADAAIAAHLAAGVAWRAALARDAEGVKGGLA